MDPDTKHTIMAVLALMAFFATMTTMIVCGVAATRYDDRADECRDAVIDPSFRSDCRHPDHRIVIEYGATVCRCGTEVKP